MNIVLLGAPGSGKDTLANKLENSYNFATLTTGALYRKEYEEGTDFGILAHKYWGSGNLCPNDMTNELMSIAYSKQTSKDLVFNGYPRSISQAKYLDSLCTIDLALLLDAKKDIVINRLLKRKRLDDTKDVISKRFEVYTNNIEDVLDYYNSSHRLRSIDGNLTPNEVFSEAYKAILEMKLQ